MVSPPPYQVHIIENCRADYLALRRAIASVARTLNTAVDFTRHLTSQVAFQALLDGNKADLMFIDIHLPGENGLSFLRRVKAERRIVPFPKIILTTSTSQSNVQDSFSVGAAGYLVKPMEFEALRESVRICLDYWLIASRLPTSSLKDNFPRC